eukprot:1162154-Pelagomonas_calceolata.AAC.4
MTVNWHDMLPELAGGVDPSLLTTESLLQSVNVELPYRPNRSLIAKREIKKYLDGCVLKERAERVVANPGMLEARVTFDAKSGLDKYIVYTYKHAVALMKVLCRDEHVLRGDENKKVKHAERCALHEFVAEKRDAPRQSIIDAADPTGLSEFELTQRLYAAVGKCFTPVGKAILATVITWGTSGVIRSWIGVQKLQLFSLRG